MKIDNLDEYNRLRGQLAFITMFFMLLIGIGILYNVYTEYLIPIPSWIYSVFFGFCFIGYLIFRNQKKYNIIMYDDEEDPKIIVIKFYAMTSLFPKYNMIKIPKNQLYKFEIKKSFANQREELILYQKIKEGLAKYKPISISALNKNHKKQIIDALNTYAKIKFENVND
ncbi:MAG: hypothetical protein ACUVQP_03415, partial [Bacteroidales bacterium]